jgi:hypothetical protein
MGRMGLGGGLLFGLLFGFQFFGNSVGRPVS